MSNIFGGVCYGMDGIMVSVTGTQTDLVATTIGGLDVTSGAHKEHNFRVREALKSSGVPLNSKKVKVCAELPEFHGSTIALDLAFAMAKLTTTMGVSLPVKTAFFGELGLGGQVRSVRGILPLLQAAKAAGMEHAVVPAYNRAEAGLVQGILISFVDDFTELRLWIEEGNPTADKLFASMQTLPPVMGSCKLSWEDLAVPTNKDTWQDRRNRRALVAAEKMRAAIAAGKRVLLIGERGAGKTMLARRAVLEMPPMTTEEILETTTVHSVSGLTDGPVTVRPFRAPHHTISEAHMAGSSRPEPSPGEISRAHNGVLMLDELPEFTRIVLGRVSYTLEKGGATVVRYERPDATFPAKVLLIAAMDPCPCGYKGTVSETRECTCSAGQIQAYHDRVAPFVAAMFGGDKGEVITFDDSPNPFEFGEAESTVPSWEMT